MLRILLLDEKPPHSDEGVNGWFADQVSATGFFRYDPTNFHGPLPIYFIYIFQKIFGHNIWAVRLPGALFGVSTVWLTSKFEKFWGRRAAIVAALLVAVSPAMNFFSRGTIHEPMLLFFVVAGIYGYFSSNPWIFFAALAGALTTKDTWALSIASFGIATLCARNFNFNLKHWKKYFESAKVPIIAGIGFVVALYTGFGKDHEGMLKFFKAYFFWAHTGQTGQGHEKPYYYWFKLLWEYETVALIGMFIAFKFLFDKDRNKKTLALFALIQFLIYTIISYKTPWLLLQITWPVFFLAAFSLEKSKYLVAGFSLLALGQTVNLCFFHSTDEKEPYVYVQTFQDFNKVSRYVEEAVERNPALLESSFVTFMGNSWPMPWVYWKFKRSAYFTYLPNNQIPKSIDNMGIIFIDADKNQWVESILKPDYYSYKFRMRPAMGEVVGYFSKKYFTHEIQ